jgi:hypothetical protein
MISAGTLVIDGTVTIQHKLIIYADDLIFNNNSDLVISDIGELRLIIRDWIKGPTSSSGLNRTIITNNSPNLYILESCRIRVSSTATINPLIVNNGVITGKSNTIALYDD